MAKNEAIKDSGSMQEFSTGCHRDASTSAKGDCSLIPLEYAAIVMNNEPVIANIALFMESRETKYLVYALQRSLDTIPAFRYDEILSEMRERGIEMREFENDDEKRTACYSHMMLEVARTYFDGSILYQRHNWKLGMPVNRLLDSGTRHYWKTLRGDIDEPHYRQFVWNMLCAMWTADNLPEMNFKEEPKRPEKQESN